MKTKKGIQYIRRNFFFKNPHLPLLSSFEFHATIETAFYSWLELTESEQSVWNDQALNLFWSGLNLYTYTFLQAIRNDQRRG